MTKPAAPAAPAFVADTLTWEGFLRDVPDRAVRRVIEQRDTIAEEAHVCARTQSWSPRSIRSGWAPELRDVVRAIDALREAHDAIADAEDEDEHEERVIARSDAFESLCDAIEEAEAEARRLAGVVAEAEAEESVEALLREADAATDDEEWQEALAESLNRHLDGDRGWTATRAEDGVLTITGWATPRCVMGDDCGGPVLGTDVDAEEHEVRGRVAFQIVRDEDGSDEPNGLFATVAEAVEAAESLAASFGVADWSEGWDVKPRWVPPTKAELVEEVLALLVAK